MAITQTGSTLTFNGTTANTGTVSSTITVPSDANIVVVALSGYEGTTNYFSGGTMTFTKGGADTTMTGASNLGDSNAGAFYCAMFYLVSPDTGANKTLKWDWIGTNTATNAPVISVTFWTGVDTAAAVRSTSGGQSISTTPYTSGTLTCVTGDLIVAAAGGSVGGEGTIDSWSNLTLLTQITANGGSDLAWATGSPTGNTTVAASTNTNFSDGGIVAIVLEPATSTSVVMIADQARS